MAVGLAGRLRLPGSAAVAGGEDGAVGTHGPADPVADARDRVEGALQARFLRLPGDARGLRGRRTRRRHSLSGAAGAEKHRQSENHKDDRRSDEPMSAQPSRGSSGACRELHHVVPPSPGLLRSRTGARSRPAYPASLDPIDPGWAGRCCAEMKSRYQKKLAFGIRSSVG